MQHHEEIKFLRKKVLKAKMHEDYLLQSIPQYAAFGAVSIDLTDIKNLMVEKQQVLWKGLLELIAQITMVDVLSINDHFQRISQTLQRDPGSIEEVMQIREYLEKVTVDVEEMHEEVVECLETIAQLDEFQYRFTREDLEA